MKSSLSEYFPELNKYTIHFSENKLPDIELKAGHYTISELLEIISEANYKENKNWQDNYFGNDEYNLDYDPSG
jgi:hypothetical protein